MEENGDLARGPSATRQRDIQATDSRLLRSNPCLVVGNILYFQLCV